MSKEEIYEMMLKMSINNHYLKRYIKFIYDCELKNNNLNEKYENHHILPKSKSFWPEYSNLRTYKWNKIKLTPRQHIIAHHILAKSLGGSMWVALWSMVNGKNFSFRKDLKINSKVLALAREQHSLSHSKAMKEHYKKNPEAKKDISIRQTGENNQFFGKKHSDETKKILSDINLGKIKSKEVKDKISSSLIALERKLSDDEKNDISIRQTGKNNSFYGKKHSDETLKLISESNKGRPNKNKGKTISEEWKRKISESQKGICRNKMVTCPHCGKEGKSSGMGKWHFDNCRMKNQI